MLARDIRLRGPVHRRTSRRRIARPFKRVYQARMWTALMRMPWRSWHDPGPPTHGRQITETNRVESARDLAHKLREARISFRLRRSLVAVGIDPAGYGLYATSFRFMVTAAEFDAARRVLADVTSRLGDDE